MVEGYMCSGVWFKDKVLINYYQIDKECSGFDKGYVDLIRFEELHYFYSQIGFVFLTFSLLM